MSHPLYSKAALAFGLLVCHFPATTFGDAPPEPPTFVDMFTDMFADATWEKTLPAAMIGSDAFGRLERRAAIFQVPGEEDPVRVEGLYLVKTPAPEPSAPPEGSHPFRILNQGGGKLIQWAPMKANRLGVQTYKDTTQEEMKDLLPTGIKLHNKRHAARYFLVKFTMSIEDAIDQLKMVPEIELAERDFFLDTQAAVVPNDSRFGEQLNLPTIKAPEAWATTVGHGTDLTDPIERDKANKTVIAIIDKGVNNLVTLTTNPPHEDLLDNLWSNPNDPIDGADNDGIGDIDDNSGWNFANDTNKPDDLTSNRHGTHVAGVVGGRGHNSKGISGVAWRIKLLPLLANTTAEAALACDYIRALNNHYNQNVRVAVANHAYGVTAFTVGLFNAINNTQLDPTITPPSDIRATWNLGDFSVKARSGNLGGIKAGMTILGPNADPTTRVLDVWDNGDTTYTVTLSTAAASTQNTPTLISLPAAYRSQPYGTVHVVSAGQASTDALKKNLDVTPLFPACYPSDLIVCVGGSTQPTTTQPNELPAKVSGCFTNWGIHAVDLFAPAVGASAGVGILSTASSPATYTALNGTSFAAAQVSGAIGLMRMVYRNDPDRKIAAGIIAANDPQPGLAGMCRTGGRLNVQKAVTNPLP